MKKDIVEFGIKRGIDIIAASFIRKGSDIDEIRDLLGIKGSYIKIIAKIENQEGLENFDDILEKADGIMVARGDLGMELPTEKVFLAQKYMVQKWNNYGKPVIVATQMLESMINNPRPTRAEAGDVANAVIDGADCVMLSGETANGMFPVGAVLMMAKIAWEAEYMINYELLNKRLIKFNLQPRHTPDQLAIAWTNAALSLNVELIIVSTVNGNMPRFISKYRPKQLILAWCTSHHVVRQLNLLRGVLGYRIPSLQGFDELVLIVIKAAKSMGLWKVGDKVISVKANLEGQDLRILDVEE